MRGLPAVFMYGMLQGCSLRSTTWHTNGCFAPPLFRDLPLSISCFASGIISDSHYLIMPFLFIIQQSFRKPTHSVERNAYRPQWITNQQLRQSRQLHHWHCLLNWKVMTIEKRQMNFRYVLMLLAAKNPSSRVICSGASPSIAPSMTGLNGFR